VWGWVILNFAPYPRDTLTRGLLTQRSQRSGKGRLICNLCYGVGVRLLTAFVCGILCLLPAVSPADTVYEVNTSTATQVGSKNNQGVYIGQSFNSGDNRLLRSANLQINREGLAIGNFTLNLYATTGSPNNYFKAGSLLQSANFSNSILSETLWSFYDFTNLNWNLSTQTVYMIGIDSESTATVKWSLNQSASQSSSTGFTTGYSGYNAQDGTSVDNGLHGATINTVPEPSALLLLAVGLGGLAVMRRCRS